MVGEQDPGYAERATVIALLGRKVEDLIRELIHADGLVAHDVVHRVKQQESAARKVKSNPGKYGSYEDLHDLLGLRVITYLASDVDKVVRLLRANFEVDESRSLDKQSGLDPDRFGYLSYHLVAKTNATRAVLMEWAPYDGIYFEIQIRSILQHSWAEIEHDLGYKSESGIPAQIRRRFARLAGLLELADSEFDAVSGEVASHVARVETVIASGDSTELAIDRDSIRALVTSEGPVARADRAIAAGIGAALEPRISRRYADARASGLIKAGLETIHAVEDAVEREFGRLVTFAVEWFNAPDLEDAEPENHSPNQGPDGRYETLSPGISLFYLYLHRMMMEPDGEAALSHVHNLEIPSVMREFRRIHDEAFSIETGPIAREE